MNRNPLDLVRKEPDSDYCNARTPRGYCKKPAGWGTSHIGKGRCRLHGGCSPGRPIKHGLYSKFTRLSVSEQLKELVEHPAFSNLYTEFGLLKVALGNMLRDVDDDFFRKIFNQKDVYCKSCGGLALSTSSDEMKKFTMIVELIEKLGRTYDRITKAEVGLKKVITIPQLQFVYKQIAKVIYDVIKDPEKSKMIYEKLMDSDLFFEPDEEVSYYHRKKKRDNFLNSDEGIEEVDYELEEENEEVLGSKDIFEDGELIVY